MALRAVVRAALVTVALVCLPSCKKKEATVPKPAPTPASPSPSAQATPKPTPAALATARDAAARLAKFAPAELRADLSALSPAEREALVDLRRAADAIDRIFWKQAGADALAMRADAKAAGGAIAGLYEIHYGPWDRLDHERPFLGAKARPAGAGFYPADLTKDALAAYVAANPSEKAGLESPYTIVARRGAKLASVAYAQAYKAELEEAAAALERAAAKVPNASLAKFLRSRAKAFRTNQYFESECDWMDIDGAGLDVTIGPYEVYEDRLVGQKAAFEAVIGVRDEASTKALQLFKEHLEMLDGALPMDPSLRSRRAAGSPIVVVNKIYAGGDAKKGVNAIAFNLPNDEEVRAKKGSKKVMLKNVTEAKFEKILRPIAAHLLDPAQAADINFETFFQHALMHEMSHGMGPGILKLKDGETTVSKVLKELYSAIEEAKADVVGLFSASLLLERGLLPAAGARFLYPSYLASMLRSIRFGAAEAHGKANLVQLSFLEREGAIVHDPKTSRFRVDAAKMPAAVKKLAAKLLELEGRGDYDGAKAFLAEHGVLKDHVAKALEKIVDVPVDIAPTYPAF